VKMMGIPPLPGQDISSSSISKASRMSSTSRSSSSKR
jgi:hypothetical protein